MVWLSKIFGMTWNGGSRIFVNICFWYKKGYEALLVLATLWCRLSETNMHQSKSATRHLKLKSKPAPATTCTLFVLGRTAANLSPHRTVHCRTKEGYSDDTFSRRNTSSSYEQTTFFLVQVTKWLRGISIHGHEPLPAKQKPGTVSLSLVRLVIMHKAMDDRMHNVNPRVTGCRQIYQRGYTTTFLFKKNILLLSVKRTRV